VQGSVTLRSHRRGERGVRDQQFGDVVVTGETRKIQRRVSVVGCGAHTLLQIACSVFAHREIARMNDISTAEHTEQREERREERGERERERGEERREKNTASYSTHAESSAILNSTHTHIHTYTHTHIHTYVHAHTRVYTHIKHIKHIKHTHTHTHTNSQRTDVRGRHASWPDVVHAPPNEWVTYLLRRLGSRAHADDSARSSSAALHPL
jgi:hypothetical protein